MNERMHSDDILLSRPTRARYVVLGLLCLMAFVLYLDRVCIAQALKPMKTEFGFSNTQTSLVLMSFTLAYILFEVPTGRWGDRYGSRRVLTRIVLWWSVFTAMTGCVWKFSHDLGVLPMPYPLSEWFEPIPLVFDSLMLLILIRFLFGAGEAGALPNAARIIAHWFPIGERGRIQGYLQASMHIGGTIAPILAAQIIEFADWRWTFILFGGVGVVWAATFYTWFREQPGEHPAVNQAEVQLIGAPPHTKLHAHDRIPWQEVLTHPNVWLLSTIITMTAFNSYFFFSWYPTYLQEARLVNNQVAGWLAAFPLCGATFGALLGGYLADVITRHASDRYRARRWLCLSFFFLGALCLFGSVQVDSPVVSAIFCAVACMLMFSPLPTWWMCAYDVCGKHVGSLIGLMNSMGGFGAIGSQYFFGAFADWRGSLGYSGRPQWDPAFYVSCTLLVVAGLLWQFIWARQAVGEREPSA